MTRLPKARNTHLSSEEIAAEALHQFDEYQAEPSIRTLAAALKVAPSTIYHHFPSRAAIIRAAVERVWNEAVAELLLRVPKPLEEDPRKVLVATGIATRRAWLSHYRLAPYLAASPEVDEFTRDSVGLMANLFERLGLNDDAAAAAFHAYTSFMIGSVLFAAGRMAVNEQLGTDAADGERFRIEHTPGGSKRSSEQTRLSIDRVMEISTVDPARDEELFARGLRKLVESLTGLD